MSLEVLKKEIQAIVVPLSVQIADVSWQQMGKDKVLQVAINHPDGVDIDLCVVVTNMIETIVDSYMVEEENFFLEVTSLGAEQPFATFEELHGSLETWVHVAFNNEIDGLVSLDGSLTLVNDADKSIEITYKDRTRTKRIIVFYDNIRIIRRAVKI
ncbi:MAG: ribosome maturation factor RimP [Culicoidibacterales bacterium]